MVYLDQLSFHTDYNKAMVRQKTKKKRLEIGIGGTGKKNRMLHGARGSDPSEMTRMEKKIMRAIEEKSVPFGEPSRLVLNKYIIMLACWGVFNPFVSFLPRNSLLVFSILSFLFFFLILLSKWRIVRCIFSPLLLFSCFFFLLSANG